MSSFTVLCWLQENEGSEAMETDGVSLAEAEEGEESLSEGEQDYSVNQVISFKYNLKKSQLQASPAVTVFVTVFVLDQDDWSSFKEVTLRDLTSDEQYDPDTVYGTSWFITPSLIISFPL